MPSEQAAISRHEGLGLEVVSPSLRARELRKWTEVGPGSMD